MKFVKTAIVFLVFAIIICLIYFLYRSSNEMESNEIVSSEKIKNYMNIRHLDVFKHDLHENDNFTKYANYQYYILNVAPNCKISLLTTDGSLKRMPINSIPMLSNNNSLPLLVFLHGARYSSKIWVDTGTLLTFARLGYPVLAIDLPGYGGSTHCDIIDNDISIKSLLSSSCEQEILFKAQMYADNDKYDSQRFKAYEKALMLQLIIGSWVNKMKHDKTGNLFGQNLTDIVLISPSMSGSYALPYLILKGHKYLTKNPYPLKFASAQADGDDEIIYNTSDDTEKLDARYYLNNKQLKLEYFFNLLLTKLVGKPITNPLAGQELQLLNLSISPPSHNSYVNSVNISTNYPSKIPNLNLKGFVSIAPIGTELFDFSEYRSLRIPTLVTYGELDFGLGLNSLKYLEQIPTSIIVPLIDSKHACYVEKPRIWNQILYNFLLAI